jgi:hypothetical protein
LEDEAERESDEELEDDSYTVSEKSITPVPEGPQPIDQYALDAIGEAVKQASKDKEFALMRDVATHLYTQSPPVKSRNYGYSKLKELLEASGLVKLDMRDIGHPFPEMVCILKENVKRERENSEEDEVGRKKTKRRKMN